MSVKLFVGASANNEDIESEILFDHCVRKYTGVPVDVTFMRASRDPGSAWGCWDMSTWATPFSGFRWAIPEYCGFKGRAIYADSDVLFLHDLGDLWETPIPDDKACLAKGNGRYCVTLWDCERAEAHLPPIVKMKSDPMSHQRLMNSMGRHTGRLDPRWNVFDGENLRIEEIWGLHVTDMSTNPMFSASRQRLRASGGDHWYDGPVRRHRRPDVVHLCSELYDEAITDDPDGTWDRYVRPYDETYGDYSKSSLHAYRAGNRFDVTRGQ